MALSQRTKDILEVAMADRRSAQELAAAFDGIAVADVAATVAALGATTNLPASAASLSTGDTYADAAVAAAIDGAVDALRVAVEARLDAAEAKVDAIISALKNAGLMDT
jgi:hypothetical protein